MKKIKGEKNFLKLFFGKCKYYKDKIMFFLFRVEFLRFSIVVGIVGI